VLANHRRALWVALGLLVAMALVFVGVGRHPPEAAPQTTLPIIGEWDLSVYHFVDDVRSDPLTLVARALSVIGGGVVTIPLRLGVSVVLAARTRWRALVVWVATWATAEIVLAIAKGYYHRGRPPGSLVETVGYSFPSGHAVAGAATAVALVLVLMPAGPARRRWEWLAAAFAFVMACSRVYLHAHWLSDVVAGVLLGVGVALGIAAIATEIRDQTLRRRSSPSEAAPEPAAPGPA
jgi:undecaprenyl-diphosphatase